jgi:transposase-like protein
VGELDDKRKWYTPTVRVRLSRSSCNEEKTLAQVATEHSVSPTQIIKWRAPAMEGASNLFVRRDNIIALRADYESRLAALL